MYTLNNKDYFIALIPEPEYGKPDIVFGTISKELDYVLHPTRPGRDEPTVNYYPSKYTYYFAKSHRPAVNRNCIFYTVVDYNGIAIPVIDNYPMYYGKEVFDLLGVTDDKDRDGIFILDYYLFINKSGQSYVDSMVQSLMSNNLFKENVKLQNDVKDYLLSKMKPNNDISSTLVTKDRYIKLKILTFIPSSVIIRHGNVFSVERDIRIYHGDVHGEDISHPRYLEELQTHTTIQGELRYDYIVNTGNEDAKHYYIKLGNNPIPIRKTYNVNRSLGCYISVYRDTIKVEEGFIPIHQLEEHGIYDSRDKCITNSDPEYKLKRDTISIKEKELLAREREIEHKERIMEYEFDTLVEKNDFAMSKHVLELIQNNERFKHELTLNQIKVNNERYKGYLELKKANNTLSNASESASSAAKLLSAGATVLKFL